MKDFRAVTRSEAEVYLKDLSRKGIDVLCLTDPEPEPERNPEDEIDTSNGPVEVSF